MQDSDLPQDGTASGELSLEQGIDALESILDAPDEEPVKEQVQTKQADDDAQDGDEPAEAEAQADDADPGDNPDESEESDEQAEAEDDGEEWEIPDDLEIDLGDGQRASFAQIKESHLHAEKRVKDMQRHMTQRTQEVADREREFVQQEERVLQFAQQARQEREQFLAVVQHFMPPEPVKPDISAENDPAAWSVYTEQKAAYDERLGAIGQLMQQQQQEAYQAQETTARQSQEWAAKERERLFEARPELKDPATFQKVNTELVSTFQTAYGIPVDEIRQLQDSRYLNVALDALAYRQLQAKKPAAKAKLQGKPKMLRAGRSRPAKTQASQRREQANANLRKTGTLEAGIDAILNLDIDL